MINGHKSQGERRVHTGNAVTEYKNQSEWKIQLTMAITFISSKDSDETLTMNTKSNNAEIMKGNETDEIIEKRFKSLLQSIRKD